MLREISPWDNKETRKLLEAINHVETNLKLSKSLMEIWEGKRNSSDSRNFLRLWIQTPPRWLGNFPAKVRNTLFQTQIKDDLINLLNIRAFV